MTKFQRDINFQFRDLLGQRKNQEDFCSISLLSDSSEVLLVLADGMGGHAAGEIASKTAVQTFEKTYKTYPTEAVNSKLNVALGEANNALKVLIKEDPSLEGMGCTLIGAHVGPEGLNWISVGDSLLLIYRNGKITRLNADHSMAPIIEESYKQGKISREEAERHPHRNALQSAVMGNEIPLIDTKNIPYPLKNNDVIIVASDGILTLTDSEIIHVIKTTKTKNKAKSICDKLILAVEEKKKPKQDNTTIQVLQVNDSLGHHNNKVMNIVTKILSLLIFFMVIGVGAYSYAHYLTSQSKNLVTGKNSISPKPILIKEPQQDPNQDNTENIQNQVKKETATSKEADKSKTIPMEQSKTRDKKNQTKISKEDLKKEKIKNLSDSNDEKVESTNSKNKENQALNIKKEDD